MAQKRRTTLLPHRHENRDLFLADFNIINALRGDMHTMEAPFYSLSTKPDLEPFEWVSVCGTKQLTIRPSSLGRATMFDKDIMIYAISQMMHGINTRRPDASHRTLRFTAYDYLRSTNRGVSGREYEALKIGLDRLSGTRIKTSIRTGLRRRVLEEFGLLERYKIVEADTESGDAKMVNIEITLSEFVYEAVQNREVLTINPDYFRLRKALERRLYEIARKHCGSQQTFTQSVENLQSKCGSKAQLKEFRRMLREIIEAKTVLDYDVTMVDDMVTFTRLAAVRADSVQRSLPLPARSS